MYLFDPFNFENTFYCVIFFWLINWLENDTKSFCKLTSALKPGKSLFKKWSKRKVSNLSTGFTD